MAAPALAFGGSEKTTKPAKTKSRSSATVAAVTVGLELAPGNAECAKSLRAEPLEDFRSADPRRVVERQKLGLTKLFVPGGELDDIFGRALGDEKAAALVLDKHRNAASLRKPIQLNGSRSALAGPATSR
jgi:hypothetical protein